MNKQPYFLHPKPIIGESFFSPMPKKYVPLEKDFVPLEKSLVWDLNTLFWKYYGLWERTYKEYFEDSLPEGKSQSHNKQFIQNSARKFFDHLFDLQKKDMLPEQIFVVEQGPGSGLFAKGFLNLLKKWSTKNHPFYEHMNYILVDISLPMLAACREILRDHTLHIKIMTLDTLEERKKLYTGKVFFYRHGNMWGQLPCDIVRQNEDGQQILYTRAVLDQEFVTYFEKTTGQVFKKIIRNKEKFITEYPEFWKAFCRALTLQVKWKKENKYSIDLPKKSDEEIIISSAIFQNIDLFLYLIDWKRGYAEIVDYIARSTIQLEKKRRIAKFDGSLSYCVNGPLIKNYLRKKGKHVAFEKLKKLNTVVTIQNDSFPELLENKTFVIISEIAAKKEDTKEFLLQKAYDVFSLQADILTFSDQAHALPDFLSVEKLSQMKVFKELPSASILSVFAMRRKTEKSLPSTIQKLKEQGIRNLIVVTGDPCPSGVNNIESGLHVMDGLKILSKDFFTGATCYAKMKDIERTKEKIKNGAKFFIVQATFNIKEFAAWKKEIKRQGLYKQASFIPSLIPLTTIKTIDAVKAFPDIAVSDKLYKQFLRLSSEEIFQKGITLAKEMLRSYKQAGIFSGAYIYSKNPKVLQKLIGFVQE